MDQDIFSERVAFRLTAATRRKLEQWAKEQHRPLANLIFYPGGAGVRGGRTAARTALCSVGA